MKYNSIGEQLIAKAKELDPNYKPDKFNDMSEAIDVILNNTGGGSSGDIWLDIAPYLSDGEHIMSISQEGYDLVYNAFSPDLENPSNKYVGIIMGGNKFIFNRFIDSDVSAKKGLNFILNITIDGVKGYIEISIYNDKSVEVKDGMDSSSNKIWYELDTMSGTITQNQYNEIKALVDTNSLAGLTFKTLSTYCPLANIFDGGIFVFRGIGLGLESTGSDRKNAIDESTITIKPDLSITFSLEEIFFPVLTQNLSNQSIISVKTDGYQENLTVGNGLKIENGELKTKDLEMAVSITATLDDLKNAVNSFSYIPYSESNKEEIISFIKNQKGVMKLTMATPVGNLYMTLRPSLWRDDTNYSYNFEGTLCLETDLSAIGGSTFNQIIVRAICWDNDSTIHFRPTIIPIRK